MICRAVQPPSEEDNVKLASKNESYRLRESRTLGPEAHSMTPVAHVLWKAKQKGCAIMANDAFRKLTSLKAMCHVSTVPPQKSQGNLSGGEVLES
jgi:hypothetical protein